MLRNCLEEDVYLYHPNAQWEGEFEWLNTLQGPQLDNIRKQLNLGVRKPCQKLSNSPYTNTCCSGGFQEKFSSLIQKQTPAYSIIRHDWNVKRHWLLWSDETIFFSFLAASTQGGFGEHREKITPCVQWNILLNFLCCGPIFLLEVLEILFRYMALWIISNTNR